MKRVLLLVASVAVSAIWLAQAEEAAPAAAAAQPVRVEAPAKPACCTGHVLAIKDGQALCCSCGTACTCTLSEDGKTCSCGKAVTCCDLAGTFCCEKCCQVSATACKCPMCGAEMKACAAKSAASPAKAAEEAKPQAE